tara:strand:+ start:1182 stop:1673 length:492 start_codon:yes stop_codon:yes gene_type:complete
MKGSAFKFKAKKRKPAAAAAGGGKRPPGNGKKFVTRKARDKEFSISKGLYDGRAMPQRDYDKLIANRERIAKNKKKKIAETKARDAISKAKSKRKRKAYTKSDVPAWMKRMSKDEIADLLGLTKQDADGIFRHKAGGAVKKTKYMSKGGPVPQRYAMAAKRKK